MKWNKVLLSHNTGADISTHKGLGSGFQNGCPNSKSNKLKTKTNSYVRLGVNSLKQVHLQIVVEFDKGIQLVVNLLGIL